MAEFEQNKNRSDEWYTPPEVFKALGIKFNLDPCSPGKRHWVPAKHVYTKRDNGLKKPWRGSVFVNPPFGERFGQVPWIEKFIQHGNGILLVRAYTSSSWWHDLMPEMEAIAFPRGKTKFIKPNGEVGRSPGHGVALAAIGKRHVNALTRSNIGMVWHVAPRF